MASMNEVTRARELLEEIKDNLNELKKIFRRAGGITWERARSYPLAHIATSLDHDHDYLAREPFTIENLIEELSDDDDRCDVCDVCDGIIEDDGDDGCTCDDDKIAALRG